MVYLCDLGSGHSIYLDNQGTQTVVTTLSSSPGQQQQASNSLQTGAWVAPPQLFRTPAGVVIKIFTAQGDLFIQIQGSSMHAIDGVPMVGNAQQMQMQQVASAPSSSIPLMQPMQPMPPMQPMKMGNMQMNLKPMEMRIGNMEMRMGKATPVANSAQGTRHFCSQCGVAVEASDRFCAHCGYKLN
jgi:zinc-ribbon domain